MMDAAGASRRPKEMGASARSADGHFGVTLLKSLGCFTGRGNAGSPRFTTERPFEVTMDLLGGIRMTHIRSLDSQTPPLRLTYGCTSGARQPVCTDKRLHDPTGTGLRFMTVLPKNVFYFQVVFFLFVCLQKQPIAIHGFA